MIFASDHAGVIYQVLITTGSKVHIDILHLKLILGVLHLWSETESAPGLLCKVRWLSTGRHHRGRVSKA